MPVRKKVKCAICERVWMVNKEVADKKAMEELKTNFPEDVKAFQEDESKFMTVCYDCYNKVLKDCALGKPAGNA